VILDLRQLRLTAGRLRQQRVEPLDQRALGGVVGSLHLLPGEIANFGPRLPAARRSRPVRACWIRIAGSSPESEDDEAFEKRRQAVGVNLRTGLARIVLVLDDVLDDVRACDCDLEGIVGQFARWRYQTNGTTTSWVKIKNPAYSQMRGRRELFEGRRGDRPRTRTATRRLVLA
jgi:hypothetical protein